MCQNSDRGSRAFLLCETQHRIKVVFQGGECGLRRIPATEPDVTAVIVSNHLYPGGDERIGEAHEGLLRDSIPGAEQHQRRRFAVCVRGNIVAEGNGESRRIAYGMCGGAHRRMGHRFGQILRRTDPGRKQASESVLLCGREFFESYPESASHCFGKHRTPRWPGRGATGPDDTCRPRFFGTFKLRVGRGRRVRLDEDQVNDLVNL